MLLMKMVNSPGRLRKINSFKSEKDWMLPLPLLSKSQLVFGAAPATTNGEYERELLPVDWGGVTGIVVAVKWS